jgi:hypothetical protein
MTELAQMTLEYPAELPLLLKTSSLVLLHAVNLRLKCAF